MESNGARLLLTLQVNVILLRRALTKCIYLVIAWVDLRISQLVYAKKRKKYLKYLTYKDKSDSDLPRLRVFSP